MMMHATPMPARRIGTLAACAAVAMALSGCVSLGPKVPDTLLSLTAQSAPAAGAAASGSVRDALVVLEPAAEARLAVTRVPVQIDDANIAYLKKTMWVERPSRQFQRLLAETLRARRARGDRRRWQCAWPAPWRAVARHGLRCAHPQCGGAV